MTGAINRWRAEKVPIGFDTSVWLSRRLYLQTSRTFANRHALNVLVLFSGALARFRCARRTYSNEMESLVHQSNVTQLRAVVTLMPASIHPQDAWRQVAYRQCLVNAAGSTGGCNTIQRIDSAMLPGENRSVWLHSVKT
jgi:hypothetical protein